jgi:hypothetical protein
MERVLVRTRGLFSSRFPSLFAIPLIEKRFSPPGKADASIPKSANLSGNLWNASIWKTRILGPPFTLCPLP